MLFGAEPQPPKFRFIAWLSMRDRLKTKDRLYKIGLSDIGKEFVDWLYF